MKKLALISVTLIALAIIVSSCGVKRDCQGNKKHYNKEGGFWM